MVTTIKELKQKGQELARRVAKFGAPHGNKNASGPHDGHGGKLGAGVTRSPYSEDAIMYRGKFYHKVSNIVQNAPGKFTITTRNGDYYLDGGKKLGGSSHDWFIKGPHIMTDRQGRDYMSVKGMQDALHLLEHEL